MDNSKIFEKSLDTIKPFMLGNGYAFREITTRISQVGGDNTYEASFHNGETGVSVFIAYAPANHRFEDYITVAFENAKGENFLLSDYFTKHSFYQDKDRFLLTSYRGNVSEKLISFFEFLMNALSGEAKSVFVDGVWEPVEFDWGSFK